MATNLTAGSMAVLGFNSSTDEFSFVLLTDVTAGTEIFFSDAGIAQGDSTPADNNEGLIRWIASTDYSAGSVINTLSNSAEFDQNLFTSDLAANGFDLQAGGDQLFAFQAPVLSETPVGGFTSLDLGSRNFLFGIQSNSTLFQGSGDGQTGDPEDDNQSGLPLGLIEGETGLALGSGPGDEDAFASLVYTGPTTGTRAAIQAALADEANWTGSATAQTQVTTNFTVTDAGSNSVPVITTVSGLTTPEDTALDITGVSVADADNDVLTVTLSSASALTVVTGVGTISGNGTGLVTIQGTPGDVNTALATISLTPLADFNGTETIDITADDGSGAFDFQTISIDITAVNDGPVLGSIDASIGFTNAQMLAGPQVLYADPSVDDVDSANFDTGVLTVTYDGATPGTVDDQISLLTVEEPGTGIRVNGLNQVIFDEDLGFGNFVEVIVGTITSDGSNGSDLVIQLTAAATPQLTNLIFDALQYQNTNAAPSGSRDIVLTLSDGDGATSLASTTTIDITAPNGAPVLSGLEPTMLLDPDDVLSGPQPVDTDVTLTDADSADFDGGNLTIAYGGGVPGAEADQLSFAVSGTPGTGIEITGTNVFFNSTQIGSVSSDGADGSDLVVDLAGSAATPAAVEALIEALQFQNTSEDPTGLRTLSITVNDGDGATSVAQDIAINVADAPPPDDGKVNYTEDDPKTVIDEGTSIIVTDPAPNGFDGATLTVTITAGGDAAEDELSFPDTGNVVLIDQGLGNFSVFVDLVRVGDVTGGTGGIPLVVTFPSAQFGSVVPTLEQVQAVARAVTYQNLDGADPTGGDRTVTMTLVDDGSISQNLGTFTVEVTPVEDPTVISDLTVSVTFDNATVTANPQIIDPDVTLTDIDTTTFDGGSLTVTNPAVGLAGDNLSIADVGGITVSGQTVSFNGDVIGTLTSGGAGGFDLVVSLTTVDATLAAVEALIEAVQYQNSAPSPEPSRVLSFVVTDGEGGTSTGNPVTIDITGAGANQPPVLADVATGVSFNLSEVTTAPQAIDADVTVSDSDSTDFDGGTLMLTYAAGRVAPSNQLSIDTSGSIGVAGSTVSFNGDNIGTITSDGAGGTNLVVSLFGAFATPAAVEALIEALQYQNSAATSETLIDLVLSLTDGDGGTATPANIAIGFVDDGGGGPQAAPDLANTDEDNAVVIPYATLLANDTDFTSAADLSLDGTPVNGTATFDDVARTVTFTPDPDYFGPAFFNYTASEGGDSSTTTVTVAVAPVNDAPDATDDTASTSEDNAVSIAPSALLANDADVDSEEFFLESVQGAVNGTVQLVEGQGGQEVIFTPDADFNGDGSFTYTVSDGEDTSTATVIVTVAAVADIADDTATVNEDNAAVIDVLANDSFEDAGAFVSAVTNGSNGTVVIGPGGSVTYTPDADFNGNDNFTYTVTAGGVTETATVSVTVNPVADIADDSGTTDEDTPLVVSAAAGLLANDSYAGAVTVTSNTDPANGTVVVNADGSYTYTPNADFNGTDSFTYTTTDVNGDNETATVTLTVNPLADIADDSGTTDEDTPLVVGAAAGLLANDSYAGAVTVTSNTDPANGTVVVNADGSYTYTPDADFNGMDSFTYTTTDVNGDNETATVTLTVNPVSDIVDDTGTTDEDTQLVVSAAVGLLANDSYLGAVSVTSNTGPANGSVVVNADGSYTYTPDANFNGIDTFTYTTTDVNGANETATVAITVNAVNDAPDAVDDGPISGTQFDLVEIDPALLLANDDDIDGDTLSLVSVQGGVNGTAFIGVNGNVYFAADDGYAGSASFTYTVSDGALTDTATVSLDISALTATFNGGSGNDNFGGTAGVDVAFGNDGNDTLRGKAGNDILFGGDGDDTLKGEAGDDFLIGGEGDDHLIGGGSDDRLEGGAGNDDLEGGGGNDTFVFKPGFGDDEIKFFKDGAGTDDVLEFQGFGNLDFATVIADATQSGNTTVLHIGQDSITMKFVDISVLHPDDFQFV